MTLERIAWARVDNLCYHRVMKLIAGQVASDEMYGIGMHGHERFRFFRGFYKFVRMTLIMKHLHKVHDGMHRDLYGLFAFGGRGLL